MKNDLPENGDQTDDEKVNYARVMADSVCMKVLSALYNNTSGLEGKRKLCHSIMDLDDSKFKLLIENSLIEEKPYAETNIMHFKITHDGERLFKEWVKQEEVQHANLAPKTHASPASVTTMHAEIRDAVSMIILRKHCPKEFRDEVREKLSSKLTTEVKESLKKKEIVHPSDIADGARLYYDDILRECRKGSPSGSKEKYYNRNFTKK